MLSVLGLLPAEEEIYRRLVTHLHATAADLATLTGRTTAEVADVLAGLVARGLAAGTPSTDVPGATVIFAAAPPAVALGGLLRQRRDDLHAAEQDLAALVEEHRVSAIGRRTSNVVEEITDISAVRHRFAKIQEAAQFEVLSMVRPNLSVVPHRENLAEKAGLRRGVHYRAILDRKALLEPGMVGDAIASIAAGQEIRIVDDVAVKIMIVDRERALVPMLHGQNNAPDSMLIQSSGLLDALIAFFEMAWERAYPLLPNATNLDLVETRPEIDELDSRILALLLSGMTDQAVAGQLGTSRRTVQRRIRELMVKASAETRIELGWYAARKGWA
jgi:sugar-specific transcriptional regulator TrmB